MNLAELDDEVGQEMRILPQNARLKDVVKETTNTQLYEGLQ